MNAGIVTSFVIGGLMLLSILAFNMNMSNSTQETTLTTIVQQRMGDMVEVLSYDFNRIGYNPSASIFDDNYFSISNSNDIRFEASATGNVRWRWQKGTANAVTSTSNPDDYYLVRTDESGETMQYPVTHFELTYYDAEGDVVADPSALPAQTGIRIEVEVIMESGEPTRTTSSKSDTYHRTVWKRTFIPNNINKPW